MATVLWSVANKAKEKRKKNNHTQITHKYCDMGMKHLLTVIGSLKFPPTGLLPVYCRRRNKRRTWVPGLCIRGSSRWSHPPHPGAWTWSTNRQAKASGRHVHSLPLMFWKAPSSGRFWRGVCIEPGVGAGLSFSNVEWFVVCAIELATKALSNPC